MIPAVRGGCSWMIGSLMALAAAGGCEKSATVLPCSQSVTQYCATIGGCPLTWQEAQRDTAFCAALRPYHAECGEFHAVSVGSLDTAATYYYDVSSGALVAIVVVTPPTPHATCPAGPTGGFTLPTCTGDISEPLPQCLDAGTDATID